MKRNVRREAGSSLKSGRAFDKAVINQTKTNLELVSLQRKPKDQRSSLYLIFTQLLGQNSGSEALSGTLTSGVDGYWSLVKPEHLEQSF